MFGKGAKRKLDEDEEGVEGKALEAPLAGAEHLSKVSYTLQRQTIFNISLMKLYSQRPPLGEPRLERRVLINNMLRRIQEELKQEGSLRPLFLPPSPPPDDPMDEGFREAPPAFGSFSAPPPPSALLVPPSSPHPTAPPGCPERLEAISHPPIELEACLTPASLLEEPAGEAGLYTPCPPTPPLSPAPSAPRPPSLSTQPPLLLPPLDPSDTFPGHMEMAPPAAAAITRTAAAAAEEDVAMTTSPAPSSTPPPLSPPPATPRPDPSLSGSPSDPKPAGVRLESPAAVLAESRCPPSPGDAPTPAPPPSSSGFLSDLALDDVLFADIDTSMYDFDACAAGGGAAAAGAVAAGNGGGGGLVKRAPDDLLKSITSPYTGPAPQVSANQPFKIDLTELDHIMEVLVGS